MRINALTLAMVAVDRVTGRVESWCRRGCARVVSIQCARCGMWVNVSCWDHKAGACDACVAHPVRPRKFAPRRKRRRSFRPGGAR